MGSVAECLYGQPVIREHSPTFTGGGSLIFRRSRSRTSLRGGPRPSLLRAEGPRPGDDQERNRSSFLRLQRSAERLDLDQAARDAGVCGAGFGGEKMQG